MWLIFNILYLRTTKVIQINGFSTIYFKGIEELTKE
jgi:hypothetical protein